MAYWTVKDDNSNISIVQTLFNDVCIDVGRIEKPYNSEEIYLVTGWNHETLSNNGSYVFRSYEDAERRIIEHYENEMEVTKQWEIQSELNA